MSNKSNKIEKLIISLLENSPSVLTVAVGIYIVIKSQLGDMADPDLLSWLLAIVCLIATSMLVDRFSRLKRIERYSEQTHNHISKSGENPSLDNIIGTRKNLAPLEDRLRYSQEIIVTGGSLFRLTNEYKDFFERKAESGTKLKFILLNPDSVAAKLVTESIVYEIDDFEIYKGHIESSIRSISALKSKYPENVEFRIQEIMPSYSIFASDIDRDDGFIMIEFYTFLTPTRQRPHLHLVKKREPVWFKYFRDQFYTIWNEARERE